jgi:hypothetical protein
MEGIIDRVRAEFLEMPGLRLNTAQIARLCGLEPAICASVLEALVGEKFLCANQDGTFARFTDSDLRPRPAKAELNPLGSRRQAS